MKKFLNLSAVCTAMLFLFLAFSMTSCSTETPIEDHQVNQLDMTSLEEMKAYVEAGNTLEAEIIESVDRQMIDSDLPVPAGISNKSGCKVDECCCKCNGTITFNSISGLSLPGGGGPVIPWDVEIIATCSSDPNSIFDPNATQVALFNHIDNPIGTTANFDILDEHFYWLFASGGIPTTSLVNVTVGDPVSQHTVNLRRFSITNLSNTMVGLRLNCDLVSYSACWDGLDRVCCL